MRIDNQGEEGRKRLNWIYSIIIQVVLGRRILEVRFANTAGYEDKPHKIPRP